MQTDSAQSSEAQDSEQTSSQQSSSAPSGGSGDAPARKKLRLSYEQYKQLANMLVLHMRKEEEMLPGLFASLCRILNEGRHVMHLRIYYIYHGSRVE